MLCRLQDELEAEYWNIYDDMTAQWQKTLEEKKDMLWPPKPALSDSHLETPDGSRASKLSHLLDDSTHPSAGKPEDHADSATDGALAEAQKAADVATASAASNGSS